MPRFGDFIFQRNKRFVVVFVQQKTSRRCPWKTEFFFNTLFLENEAQINKNKYGAMLFMSKQVSLLNISLILRKMKVGPKGDKRPFCTKAILKLSATTLFRKKLELQLAFGQVALKFCSAWASVTCSLLFINLVGQ